MLVQILLLVLGLVILIKGADWLIDGASTFAKKKKVSDLAIGLTVVAFGTSAPELVVNVIAAWQGHEDIVFGNIIGSNNFNLFIILGIAGLISPLLVGSSTVYKEIPFSFVAAVVLFLLANNLSNMEKGFLSRNDGLVLLFLFALFLWYVYKQLSHVPSNQIRPPAEMSNLKIAGLIFLGLCGLVLGGRLVVTSALEMSRDLGVSEKVIGLTIVAAGTSLPELATSVVAALKKNNDIAMGNIVGSNIFNILLILGLSAVISPLHYDPVFNTDLYILSAGTVFLFLAMLFSGKKKLDRWEAGTLLIVYLLYTASILIGS